MLWTSALSSLIVAAHALSVQIPLSGETHQVQIDEGLNSSPAADDFPHPPRPRPIHPIVIDMSDETIAQILAKSLNDSHEGPPPPGPPRTLPLHKLAWLLNISDADGLKKLLADPKAELTFLAPDDRALSPPHRHSPPEHHEPHHGGPPHDGPGHHGPPDHHGPPEHRRPDHGPPHHGPPPPPPHHRPDERGPPHRREPPPPFHFDEEMYNTLNHPFHATDMHSAIKDDDSDKDEDRKRKIAFFKKLVGMVLRYHAIDGIFAGEDLANKATVATELLDTRIRVGAKLFPVPALTFNNYAETAGVIVKAKNGLIYLLTAPLFPPAPAMTELFVFPTYFSTLTSGLQKVGLELKTFEPSDDHMDSVVTEIFAEIVKGLPPTTSYTIFAPTNNAFRRLGLHLNGVLFSPFGQRALKGLLEYHVVKDVVLYSDFNINATVVSSGPAELPASLFTQDFSEDGWNNRFRDEEVETHLPTFDVKVTNYALKTLFNDSILPVDIYEFRRGIFHKGPLERSIWVGAGDGNEPGSRVQVLFRDFPAFKGAIHVIDYVIRPPFARHHEDHDHPPPHHHEEGERRRGPRKGFPLRPKKD